MAAKEKPLPANVLERQTQYAELGLTNASDYKTLPELEKALIENVYKLNPVDYAARGKFAPTVRGQTYNVAKATENFQFEQPKIAVPGEPTSFTQAVYNFSNILRTAQSVGVDNLNKLDQATLKAAARSVRDFDSKSLGEGGKQVIANITDAVDAIDSINSQRKTIEIQQSRAQGFASPGDIRRTLGGREREAARGRLATEQDTLRRFQETITSLAPKLEESLTRFGLSDIAQGIGRIPESLQRVDTGLAALRGEQVFGTGALQGRLNINVTDEQILNDINSARRNEYKSLYDIGTAAVTDLQSQLSTANAFLADLPSGDRRRAETQKTIDNLSRQLSEAQADTLEARNLYENYQPIGGTQAQAAISSFRETLRLPEERTLQQIETIDPEIGRTVRALSSQYAQMAAQPVGPTTTPQTEQLRQTIEQEALNQLRLGSTIGQEERRGYEQAVRAAQTARGNIFGLGPAVQEAAQIGAAGEQRKLARYGAAQQFLASGETTGAAQARDIALRDALTQSRLGAAAGFVAGGPSMYNLASQRLGQQQAALGQYLAAAQPQPTQGFQATPSQFNPYAYVNPQAGFIGAQNAANIYGALTDYAAETYGAQTRAQAATYTSPSQAFGNVASGLGNLFSFSGKLPFCWVAREVYGEDNPKWLQFREWMLTKASDNLRNFYIEYGERIAESIRNKPKIKAIIRKWMDSKIG